jgi:hypothetical protein
MSTISNHIWKRLETVNTASNPLPASFLRQLEVASLFLIGSRFQCQKQGEATNIQAPPFWRECIAARDTARKTAHDASKESFTIVRSIGQGPSAERQHDTAKKLKPHA